MSDGAAASEFAELLVELKERSGLSYGTLARRLHMSTSTLHRYCKGDAVPAEYAPVERLARLCKASPDELVELHRRWVRADAFRGRKGPEAGPAAAASTAAAPAPALVSEPEPEPVPDPQQEQEQEQEQDPEPESPRVVPSGRRRTRTALVAGVAVAAVLGAVTLAVSLPSGDSDDGRRGAAGAVSAQGREAGSAGASEGAAKASRSVSPSTSTSASASASGSRSPSASPSVSPSREGGKKGGPGAGAASDAKKGTKAGPAPLTVAVRPYAWDTPCSQHYLIDRAPERVSPPPLEQDAPAWAAAHGAVASGEQFVALTVQGTGEETVVINDLTVRMVGKRTPLAWNDYAMGYPGVGCGGGVPARFFTVALDAMRPSVEPAEGNRDFPYKVSESDPEVYYILADASAYDVSWYLELAWSSGSRHGTLVVDDKGRPFRVSGDNGRPAYEFPLGGAAWVKAGTTS
ncbi:helix-turn-helix domain-containing protein [Streptomyces sp. NPDC048751]|uniref:helix-turn-helix domain-containing protein n=1 Tax=Streptomyces sp. NPDC048751 TaxID=3365591 RepID=UPI00371F0609